uniref:Uncharacterized protein n=1 Tax=Lotus japonicus TaxID=34305 RepID=I3T030_LOTJA|nr:unknown [Lotus japonicus]
MPSTPPRSEQRKMKEGSHRNPTPTTSNRLPIRPDLPPNLRASVICLWNQTSTSSSSEKTPDLTRSNKKLTTFWRGRAPPRPLTRLR